MLLKQYLKQYADKLGISKTALLKDKTLKRKAYKAYYKAYPKNDLTDGLPDTAAYWWDIKNKGK